MGDLEVAVDELHDLGDRLKTLGAIEASEHDIKIVADRMRRSADEAGEIKAILSAVADLDGWRGKTAEVFADKADGVTDDLACRTGHDRRQSRRCRGRRHRRPIRHARRDGSPRSGGQGSQE